MIKTNSFPVEESINEGPDTARKRSIKIHSWIQNNEWFRKFSKKPTGFGRSWSFRHRKWDDTL
jgi:hypothetical protein